MFTHTHRGRQRETHTQREVGENKSTQCLKATQESRSKALMALHLHQNDFVNRCKKEHAR